MTNVEKCGLCRQVAELQDSHFLPPGFYRLLDDGDGGGCVLIQGTTALLSSAQARARFLCSDCESRFNRNSEDWFLRNCWRSPTEFRLHAALSAQQPTVEGDGFRAFDGRRANGVDMNQLCYFGFSIFWRASATPWRFGKATIPQIRLGPYAESIRRYLLDKGPVRTVPDGVMLLATVSRSLDNLYNQHAWAPWRVKRTYGCQNHKFLALGIDFNLVCGQIPVEVQSVCSARHGLLFMSDLREKRMIEMTTNRFSQAKKVGKLARSHS